MTDIRDIKGPVPLDESAGWLLVLAAAVCLALVGLLFWCWRQRQTHAPDHRLAAALAGLDPDAGDADDRTFYFRLAQLVRAMLQARFGLAATAMTATEIAASLEKTTLEPAQAAAVAGLFARAETVCFAGQAVTPADRARDWATARAQLPGGRP
jgi:hypothetical protein